MYLFCPDSEEDAVDVGMFSMEQLPDVGSDELVLGRKPTSLRKLLQRLNGFLDAPIPLPGDTLIELGNPFNDESNIAFGRNRYRDLVLHDYFKKGYFCSSFSKTTSASSSSPASMAARPNLIPSRASRRTAKASIR